MNVQMKIDESGFAHLNAFRQSQQYKLQDLEVQTQIYFSNNYLEFCNFESKTSQFLS